MKKLTIIYWIVTGLLFAVMLMASITDLLHIPAAVEGFKHLGYPVYLLSFLGVARILGIIAIAAPGYPRLKEWAYAGFAFDLIGAIYSSIANGDPLVFLALPFAVLILIVASYKLYHKRLKTSAI